uniref:Putative squamosa promoter binding protein-like 3a n=1 Tax=Davidia involucrata TaxID=16924 RepID=A0A5B7A0V8_DAVIN
MSVAVKARMNLMEKDQAEEGITISQRQINRWQTNEREYSDNSLRKCLVQAFSDHLRFNHVITSLLSLFCQSLDFFLLLLNIISILSMVNILNKKAEQHYDHPFQCCVLL